MYAHERKILNYFDRRFDDWFDEINFKQQKLENLHSEIKDELKNEHSNLFVEKCNKILNFFE